MSGNTTSNLPQRLYRAEQVRELDRIVIQENQIPGLTLMERAGLAAFNVLKECWPEARQIAVVCGAGNNAGDGYILAKCAMEQGLSVKLYALTQPQALKGDAGSAAKAFLKHKGGLQDSIADVFEDADVIVDAILGTGLDREVTGDFREAIEAINASGKAVLALDIPSGLNANTGSIMGNAVRARHTVTFIGLKQGMFTGQGGACCGTLHFSGLDVPETIYQQVKPAARRIDYASLKSFLPKRKRTAHKGHFGHVLIVGGDYGFAGAACMAGEAAARTGAGLVSLATRKEHAVSIPMARPELMAKGVEAAQDLHALLERTTVVAIGPGLGQSDWAIALLAKILETDFPLVIDADGLNLLAREPASRDNWVLTPHPGEAARLLGCDTKTIETDRFAAITALQEKYHGVMVLKGNGTLIADPHGHIFVCNAGNPGMASGGMGDILTGIIAGLIAQGLKPEDAACLGVCLHGNAGDRAAERGERGMLATDLFPFLRQLVNP